MDLSPVALYSNLRADVASYLDQGDISFLEVHPVWPDATPREAACASILKSLLKKLQVQNSQEHDRLAASKFMAVNDRCKNWTLQLPTIREEILYGEFRRAMYEFFTPNGYDLVDSHEAVLDKGRCGPGASLLARGGDSYTKLFSSPLSCTHHSLYFWYRRYVSSNPTWYDAEFLRTLHFGEAHIVDGNRLSFVPKDDKVSRSICTEPSLNMYFQLGFGHILEKRLKSRFGIDLSVQPFKNQELARLGSRNGEFVTIDLSSASDSIALSMLNTCIPRGVMNLIKMYRSAYCDVPQFGKQELHMVSTMGNGFTFPLQTAIFSCVVEAAMRVAGVEASHPRGSGYGNWGVFGDDIVCPVACYRYVRILLELLGFTINLDKSFDEGPFRESCGGDYFRGHSIRGVYVKSIETPQERYAVINQLNLFSSRTGVQLPRTVQSLLQTVRWTPVPLAENDDSGIKVPSSMVRYLPVSIDTQSVLYERYEAIGQKIRILDGVIKVPRGAKWRIYNPNGLLVSFLRREINSCSIGVRHDSVRYRRKRAVTPWWDYVPTVHPHGWVDWQRWETSVYLNLFG